MFYAIKLTQVTQSATISDQECSNQLGLKVKTRSRKGQIGDPRHQEDVLCNKNWKIYQRESSRFYSLDLAKSDLKVKTRSKRGLKVTPHAKGTDETRKKNPEWVLYFY